MIGGGFLGGGISIVPAGKAIIYASMTTEDGANIPNAVFKAVRTGSTVTVNGGVDGRAELLVDAGHTYTVTVTPAGGSYLNNSQTVATASAKSYAVKFYLYPSKANEASTTASLNALNTSISTHASNKANPHAVTKAQVGLGNVTNTSDASKPISTATQTALDGKAEKASTEAHINNKVNPHGVTKAQVGLGSADNTSDVNKPISTATQTALNGTVKKTGDAMTGRLYANRGIAMESAGEATTVNKRTDISYNSPWARYRWDVIRDKDNKNVGEIRFECSNAGSGASSCVLSATNYKDDGSVVNGDIIISATGAGDTYATLPMRTSPSSSDAVNTKYVLDRVGEMVDYVKLYQHSVRVFGAVSKTFSVALTIINTSSDPINSNGALHAYLGTQVDAYYPCSGMFWSDDKTTGVIATEIRGNSSTSFRFRGMNMSSGDPAFIRNINWTSEEVNVTDWVRGIL